MKETIVLTKKEDGTYSFDMPEPKPAPELEMQKPGWAAAGIIDKIPDYQLAGVPLGKAAKAMLVAAVGDALGVLAIKVMPASFQSSYSIAIMKALTIMALNWHPVKNFIGGDAVESGSIILAYEGIQSIFNIRAKVYTMLAKVTNSVSGNNANAASNGNGGSTTSTIEEIV